MRFDSAPVSSDFTFARSVTMKRFDTSAPCPTSSSVAGSMSCSHIPLIVISVKCDAISTTKIAAEIASAGPAARRGSSTMR